MAVVAKLIGAAGTGKTTRQLQTMEKLLDLGVGLDEIGFVSFTRAARQEAASRAAEKFNAKQDDLEANGWFRTLHSVCYRCLEASGSLITPSKEDRKWLGNALGYDVAIEGSLGDLDYAEQGVGGDSHEDKQAQIVLRLWSHARNRIEPFAETWKRYYQIIDGIPSKEFCEKTIDRYEQAKLIDHRLDFTDLLGAFAGYRFRHGGPEEVEPQGWVPALTTWILDEAQDLSPLSAEVFKRLIATPSVKWAYLSGDIFQSIYGFSGASPAPFAKWEAAKEKIMRQTYRCPAEILALGEDILQPCSNYFYRGVNPAPHDGWVEYEWFPQSVIDSINPTEDWLIIARTNFLASRLGKMCDEAGIPWQPTKGLGGWAKPKRNAVCLSLLALERGQPIDCKEWQAILDTFPAKGFFAHGTKSRWAQPDHKAEESLAKLEQTEYGPSVRAWGATEQFCDMVRKGEWTQFVEGADQWRQVESQHGWDAACNPKCKIGTIHSVKGAESENVLLLTTISKPVHEALATQDGEDEERRVFYVGATRAKRRLVVVKEKRAPYRMEI